MNIIKMIIDIFIELFTFYKPDEDEGYDQAMNSEPPAPHDELGDDDGMGRNKK